MDHSSRLFWAMHSTHHNSNEYNLTTGFRSSVLQPLYRYVFHAVGMAGFSPAALVMFVYAVTQIYGNLVHTQAIGQLGWIERDFVTPSHHRVHHASNTPYLDKNMGMLFITWDKLFGTFEVEGRDPEPIRYGTVSAPQSSSPWALFTYELKNIWHDVRLPNLTMWQRLCCVRAAWLESRWPHADGETDAAEWNAAHPNAAVRK